MHVAGLANAQCAQHPDRQVDIEDPL
jgi:hypothetical protein